MAYPLTAHLNAILRDQPEGRYVTDVETGLTLPEAGSSSGLEKGGDEQDVAICVGLDGWHYSRAELDRFDDPVEAHWRRVSILWKCTGQLVEWLISQGAAFTFNLPSYLNFLQHLRIPLIPDPAPLGIPFPTFDHALKDPSPSPFPILPQHRIVIIEGLYTMLDKPGWRDCAEMMDMRVWVESDREVCRRRLIKRNYEAGVVDDLKACEKRGESACAMVTLVGNAADATVDASDMVNGDEVRQFRYYPTDTVTPSDSPRRTSADVAPP